MVMHVELQATCSALGYQEGDKYVKEPDCLETVKDLIRFLKREDDTCDIRRQLGDAQILQKDLLPIVKNYKDDSTLFETVLRLMVNLTQPTVLCFGNKLPTDKMMRNHALEIDTHLQTYKEAFVDEELFAVLAEKVGNILKLDWENRQEEDKLLLERLLILLRNVLHIPPNPDLEQRTDDDASLHDQILWVFHVSGLEDMVLYIASSENERQLCMHLLEIVSLMFREQTPETLACAGVQRSVSEKEKDERELQMIREKERVQKKINMLKHSTRHSRFGGTYVVTNMKSITDRDLIYHKSQADVQNFSLDSNKHPKKKAKNREPIKDKEITRRSTLSIRLSLKEFCVQFLENAYNPLMYAVKDNLTRERTQEHDETYYMWALRFFMEFCRHHSKRVELVSETLAVPTFHYIYTNLITYYEMIMTEKTEAITWSKRVHLALKAYQELLLTVDMMDRSKNPQLMESARVIKSNVFYMMEFRDIFVTLLKKFDQSKQSRTYLRDLVETTHLFVKMLEHFCKKTSHLIVQKKTKKHKKKKPKAAVHAEPAEPTPQELEDLWDEISGHLSAIFQGREEVPEVAPFDAASDVEVDHQRVEAMCRIQDSMRNRAPGEAVAIFRAAREVWPERDEFGTQNMQPEEEFMALREIFMAPLPKPSRPSTQSQVEEQGVDEDVEHEEEVVREEMETVASEQEFDFTGFLMSFCKPDILKSYGVLLADFEKNSDHTNHCIVKMFHRISVDLGFPAMIFQASIFRVFQKIMLGPYAKLSRFREMYKFATHIVRLFVETAEKNKKVFMEMMFWKGSQEAQEICRGYGTASHTKSKTTWKEDLEQELERLFMEFRDADDPGKDTADLIMERLTDPSKTRGQVIGQLKRQGLIHSAKELKKTKPSSKKRGWPEEDELELIHLFNQYKGSHDVLGDILSNLSHSRTKHVVTEKLLSLGLVNHKSELHIRRKQKSGGAHSSRGNIRDSDSDGGDVGTWNDDREECALPTFTSTSKSSGESDAGEGRQEGESDAGEGRHGGRSGGEDVSVEVRLNIVVANGYQEQIRWIQRGLRRTAEDRERGDQPVAVPIVPLTEENETAMEDKMFLDFLGLIGISPPASEQEAFWRIPAELSLFELKNIAEGLELNEEGEPQAAHKIRPVQKKKKKPRKTKKAPSSKKADKKKKEEEKRRKQKEEKQKSMDRMKALKALAKQRKGTSKRKRTQSNMESDQDGNTDSEKENVAMETDVAPIVNGNDTESSVQGEVTPSLIEKKTSRFKKVIDSDSDSDDNRLRIAEDSDNSDTDRPPSKRPKLFDSDSEDDSQTASQQTTIKNRSEKQNKLFHSDSESSDEDNENNISTIESVDTGLVNLAPGDTGLASSAPGDTGLASSAPGDTGLANSAPGDASSNDAPASSAQSKALSNSESQSLHVSAETDAASVNTPVSKNDEEGKDESDDSDDDTGPGTKSAGHKPKRNHAIESDSDSENGSVLSDISRSTKKSKKLSEKKKSKKQLTRQESESSEDDIPLSVKTSGNSKKSSQFDDGTPLSVSSKKSKKSPDIPLSVKTSGNSEKSKKSFQSDDDTPLCVSSSKKSKKSATKESGSPRFDDDTPLSVNSSKKSKKSATKESGSSQSDDVPLSVSASGKSKKSTAKESVKKKRAKEPTIRESDSSQSDDEIPLSVSASGKPHKLTAKESVKKKGAKEPSAKQSQKEKKSADKKSKQSKKQAGKNKKGKKKRGSPVIRKRMDVYRRDTVYKPDSSQSSSEDEPIIQKVKPKPSQTKRQRSDSSSDGEPLSSAKTKKPESKRQRVNESDTEMSPLQLSATQSQDMASTQDITQDTSKLFNSDDDSSDDEPLQVKMSKAEKTSETFPATLLTQPRDDSDSDVDDHVPLRKVIRKNVIDSDED